MDCKNTRELLSEYLDDRLEQGQRREIAAHIDSCGSCRAELKDLRKTVDLLRGLPYVPAPAHVADRVLDATVRSALKGGRGVAGPGFKSWLPVIRSAAAAAVIMIFAYVGHSYIEKESRSRAPEPGTMTAIVETSKDTSKLAEGKALGKPGAGGELSDRLGMFEGGPAPEPERQGAWGTTADEESADAPSRRHLDQAEHAERDEEPREERSAGSADRKSEDLKRELAKKLDSVAESASDLGSAPGARPAVPPAAGATASGADKAPSPAGPEGGFAGGRSSFGSPGSDRRRGPNPEHKPVPSSDAKKGKADEQGGDLPVVLLIRESAERQEDLKIGTALRRAATRGKSSLSPADAEHVAEKTKSDNRDSDDNGAAGLPSDLVAVLKKLEARSIALRQPVKDAALEPADSGAEDAPASKPEGYSRSERKESAAEEYVIRVRVSEYAEFKKALADLRASFHEIPSTAYLIEMTRLRQIAKAADDARSAEGAVAGAEKAREALAGGAAAGDGAKAVEGPFISLTIRIVREKTAPPEPAPEAPPAGERSNEKPQSGGSGEQGK